MLEKQWKGPEPGCRSTWWNLLTGWFLPLSCFHFLCCHNRALSSSQLTVITVSTRLLTAFTHFTTHSLTHWLEWHWFLLCVCPLSGNWEWTSTRGPLLSSEPPPSSEAWSEWPSAWLSSSLNPPMKSHTGCPSWSRWWYSVMLYILTTAFNLYDFQPLYEMISCLSYISLNPDEWMCW